MASLTESDWATHREQLTEWYLRDGKSLHQVMSLMESTHGFVAKKNQYEKYLHGRWKLSKKTKSNTWKAIAPIVHELDRRGQKFQLWIEGERKSLQTVRKETRRYVRSDHIHSSSVFSKLLPAGVVIRSILPQSPPRIAVGLPFFSLEQHVNVNLCISQSRNTSNLCLSADGMEDVCSVSSNLDIKVYERLQVVTLNENENEQSVFSSTLKPNFGPYKLLQPDLRTFLFSLANNSAALSSFQSSRLIRNTQPEMYAVFSGLKRSVIEFYSLRAIAKSIYQSSIQNGDAILVDFLLSQSLPEVKPNCFIHDAMYSKLTPIEKAAQLQNTRLVKILLKHGADPNLTRLEQRRVLLDQKWPGKFIAVPGGALDYLVPESLRSPKTALCPELFELLVENGAMLDVATFQRLIKDNRCGRSVKFVLSRDAASNFETWSSAGVFHAIFKYQVSDVLLWTFEILKQSTESPAEIDLKAASNDALSSISTLCMVPDATRSLPSDSCTLVNIAASRGELRLVKMLLADGCYVTEYTLPLAIQSGNGSLVEWLLGQKLTLRCANAYWDVASSAAVYVRDVQIIGLISTQCAGMPGPFILAMKATSRTGNWDVFQHLCDINPDMSAREEPCLKWINSRTPKLASLVLAYAVRDRQDTIALTMLDAGASVNEEDKQSDTEHHTQQLSNGCSNLDIARDEPIESPLSEALKRRDLRMTNLLLDAGVTTYSDCWFLGNLELVHAVEWGDPTIIETIFRSGLTWAHCSCIEARNVAIARADIETLDMLLDAGIPINNDPVRNYRKIDSALKIAVRSGDLNVVEHILQSGVDPGDSSALLYAYFKDFTMFDLILRKHVSLHPKGCKGWGGELLKISILSKDMELFERMLQIGANANLANEGESTTSLRSLLEMVIFEKGVAKAKHHRHLFNNCMSAFGYAIRASTDIGIEFVDCLLQTKDKTGCKPETIVNRLEASSNVYCETAFLTAVQSGHIPTIELFIRHQADVNYPARSSIRRTPLQRAVEVGNLEVVQLLIRNGADVNGAAAQRRGATALQLAAIKGYIRITLLLLEHGADVHAPASKLDGRTPLEGAAEHGRLDTVALLLRYYGKYEAKYEKEFAQAIAYAEENQFGYIAQLLRNHQDSGSELDEFFDFGSFE